jgi:hypothetical protein
MLLLCGVFDIDVDEEGVHGIARLSLGLPIPSKLAQNPAQTILAHSNLDVDTFNGVATCKFCTQYDNVGIMSRFLRNLVITSKDW